MTVSSEKPVERMEAEAAAWAAKLDATPNGTHPGLDEWFARDSRHAGALLRAQAALAVFDPESRVEDQPVVAASRSAWKKLAFLGGGTAALAASLAAVLVIDVSKERYQTQIGEVRSLALSDGSSVSIDAKSRIDIDFDARTRDVHLQAGRVLFRATHNAERPFRVVVGSVIITDIGTAFQVTDEGNAEGVEVLVTEGSVRVDAPAGRIELVAGQRARFSKIASDGARPELGRVAPADIERALAWRQGLLELNGETLASAVAAFNRHSRLQLRIGDASLARERLYGSFRMDDAAGFARATAASLGTEARTEPNGIVIGPQK